jgi:RHS repeat-associated protein
MRSAGIPCRSNPRFVGDPIDVVTGANTDAPVDLVQRGPVLFQWVRYYSSARCQTPCSLGWGHSHDFDRLLYRDLDGLRYEDPLGSVTEFEDLEVGDSQPANGMLLTRTEDHTYVIAQPGEPDQEFLFSHGRDVARLAYLRHGEHTVAFRYTGNGVLSDIVDSRGRFLRVVADQAGRVLQLELVDPKSNRPGQALLTYEYDAAGNLVRATDLYKTTLTFAYDAGNRMTRRTDRRGYSFHFEYDGQGRCVHSRGDDGLFEVFLTYEPEARTTFVRRGDGGQWIYFYNDAGAITQVTDPYGNATQYVQDDLGRTAQEVDPNGNITLFHYNWFGQHDYRIGPKGQILPPRDVDPDPPDPLAYELPETPFEWEFGRLLDVGAIKSPQADDPVLSHFPAAVFNTFLGKTNAYDPTAQAGADPGAPESVQEDDFGQPLERTGPNFTERWKYDPNGNPVEHQDRGGAVWRSVYKSWNALSQEIDPLGHVTAYEHSVQGLVAKVTDPGGTVTEYGYDLKENLVEVRRHGRVRERYSLDKAGNIIAKKNTHGRTLVAWEIGAGNLATVRTLGSGEKHAFAYDEMGRVTKAETPAGTAEFSYDEDDRILSDTRDGKGVVHEFDLDQLITTTYFNKFKVAYEVNDNGDLTVIDPLGGEHRFQRSVNGLIGKHFADGDRELCQFDARGRCLRKALVRSRSSAGPWMRGYAYSSAGDLVSVSDTLRGLTRYSYDAAHRLAQEVLPDGTPRRFAYDAAGNLHAQPGLANVAMGSGNRLAQANGDRFTYNERDHLSERTGPSGTTRYEYNDLDMLVRCDVNGEAWTASYDAYCRRVAKTWRGRTTTYYWDDFRLAAEVRHDGSVRIYVYADETALVPFLFVEYAGLEAAPESGLRYYVFTNQIGTPINAEDADGKPCWTARIDPYGWAEVGNDSTLEMPLRFPGHYYDPETGLHYNRFRYFSPELGRYLQSDPLGLGGGINLYAYPARPLTAVDIDGLGTKPAKGGSAQEQALRHARAMCRQHPRGTPEGDKWRYERYRLQTERKGKPVKTEDEWKKHPREGGIRGKKETRDHIDKERDRIQTAHPDWVHTHGGTDAATGDRKKEFHVPGPDGGQDGSTRADLSFRKPDGNYHHVNTVDTKADGSMTDREKANAERLQQARPNDTVETTPKPK